MPQAMQGARVFARWTEIGATSHCFPWPAFRRRFVCSRNSCTSARFCLAVLDGGLMFELAVAADRWFTAIEVRAQLPAGDLRFQFGICNLCHAVLCTALEEPPAAGLPRASWSRVDEASTSPSRSTSAAECLSRVGRGFTAKRIQPPCFLRFQSDALC